jgi:transposase
MILNLPSITVTRVEEENGNDYHVYAVPNREPQFCLECLGTAFYGHGSKTHLYMDTPIHGRRVGVLLESKRYKCRGCSKTFPKIAATSMTVTVPPTDLSNTLKTMHWTGHSPALPMRSG